MVRLKMILADSTPMKKYISLVLNSGSGLSHDYANQSIQEDPPDDGLTLW